MNHHCVITTIHEPTKAVEAWYGKFGKNLIVVGDMKTPLDWNYGDATYINPLQEPFNHYARKNFGYLEAMRRGADLIYDTDDDNTPSREWKIREHKTPITHTSNQKWCNVYEPLTSGLIWPRGFPLNLIKEPAQLTEVLDVKESSIQQGLANLSPDVDAIWRLTNNRMVSFWVKKSIWLKNSWCPINSQSIWWFQKAFPLMYLPTHVSFRMTDIWRGFIAQRCIWELGEGVTFHSPSEVFQDRNEHDLMKDFIDEIPGYQNNNTIIEILSELQLKSGEEFICQNLLDCYGALIVARILPSEEIWLVNQWIKDYEDITANLG